MRIVMRALGKLTTFSIVVAGLVVGCSTETQTVPLLTAAGIPVTMTPPGDISLEVLTRSTAVQDPLQVVGTHVAYADLEGALGHAVSTATIPWADAHKNARAGGLQLVVDVVEASAEWSHGRLKVTLTTRATLRTRRNQDYVAQTQASCHDAGLTDPDHGALVLYACMTRLGRDLAGWLGGVPL